MLLERIRLEILSSLQIIIIKEKEGKREGGEEKEQKSGKKDKRSCGSELIASSLITAYRQSGRPRAKINFPSQFRGVPLSRHSIAAFNRP